MNTQRALRGALALLTAGYGFLGAARAGAEDAAGSFAVLARADLASVEFVDPVAPAVPHGQVIFATPGSAQATVDSLGTSSAFASTPYPGEVLVALPGTMNGVATGNGFPSGVPDYPFIAQSSHPTQPGQDEQYGPFSVSAHSNDRESNALATAGIATGQPSLVSGRAAARALRTEAGGVTGDARATMTGFTMGILKIGEIVSEAAVTNTPGTAPAKTTSFEIRGASINGVPVTINEHGIQAGEQTVPVDAAGAAKQLSQAGLVVQYRPAQSTDTSVSSASLSISYSQEFPGRGKETVTVLLGQVSVGTKTAAAAAGSTTEPVVGTAESDVPATPPEPAPEAQTAAGSVPVDDALASGSPALPVPGPAGLSLPAAAPVPSPAPAPASQTAAPPTVALIQPAASIPVPPKNTPGTLFAALLISGLVLVVGSRLLGGTVKVKV